MKLPETKEELLELMEIAFKGGQKSIEGVLKCEEYGNMDFYASEQKKYDFKEWSNKIWKYGVKPIKI